MTDDPIDGRWIANPRPMIMRHVTSRVWNLLAFCALVIVLEPVFGAIIFLLGTIVMLIVQPIIGDRGFLSFVLAGLVTAASVAGALLASIRVGLVACRSLWQTRRAVHPEIDLLESSEDVGLAVVEVVYMEGRRIRGADRAVIWCDGALIHFRGVASYFGLASADVQIGERGSSTELDLVAGPSHRIIRMCPLHVDQIDNGLRFKEILQRFRRLPWELPEHAERIAPPFDRYRRDGNEALINP